MEAVLKLPLDYRGSLVFLRLTDWFKLGGRTACPAAVAADYIYVSVWRALALLGQEGRELGRITPPDRPLLEEICAAVTCRSRGDETPDETPHVVSYSGPLLTALTTDIKLFVADGPDLVCLRFAQSNAHLREGARNMNQRGGDMRAYHARMKRAESEVFQQTLLIQPDKLVDAEGRALDHALVRRLKMLVVRVDNALFKPTRPPYLYTEELIQSGLLLLAKMTDAEIAEVAQHIALNREHPALNGATTEKLIPQFGNILTSLNS